MLTKWFDVAPFDGSLNLLQSRMNRLFNDFGRPYGYGSEWDVVSPRINFYDHGDSLELKAEVPGLSKEDLSVKIQGNYLEISANRKPDAPEGYKAHRVERGTSTFTRSFTMPSDIDADKVEASLKDESPESRGGQAEADFHQLKIRPFSVL
jgi:HSP20 family protein